jgi:hypothetical protein
MLLELFHRPGAATDHLSELPLYQQVLADAHDRVRGWGGQLIFVFVPAWERYFRPDTMAHRDSRQSVLAIARGLNLPVVDLGPTIDAYGDIASLFARQNLATAHFSATGHDLLAREIGRAIVAARKTALR